MPGIEEAMSKQFPTSFFLRPYIVIAAGILIIALALDSLLVWVLPSNEQSNTERFASDFAMIELMLLESGPSPERVTLRFNILGPQLQSALALPVTLYEPAELGDHPAFFTMLDDGEIHSYRDGESREMLVKLIANTGQVVALGPLPEESSNRAIIETGIILSYYFLVALLLFLWIRPFYRDLGSLRFAASQFGRDNFETRVSVAANSSILPVAQSFNKMAERIQYLVTAHHDLTNAVAHELRTPLARFKFSLEMVAKIHDRSRLENHVDAMKLDVKELEELIDEMLSYAKLSEENLQLERSPIPINAWLERQLLLYRNTDIPVRLQLQQENDAVNIPFHSELMARSMHNIIRNCLRYAESEVLVRFTLEGESAILRITDDGPGIPDIFHESVFEPFARLDTSRDRQSGGYGLGLAIARRILQRHGGNIHVENREPHGARFVLHWPYN